MQKLIKPLIGLSLLSVLAPAIFYFAVLPYLGQPTATRNFTGIKGNAERGKYLTTASGCIACHTDLRKKGKFLAGGPPLKTKFGTFFAPNITPHRQHGIGGWSLNQFAKAVSDGISPNGKHYFPSFPYTSYVGMTNQDLADIKAYLDGIPPIAQLSKPNQVRWPFSDRNFVGIWKSFYFDQKRFTPSSDQTKKWNRGAYLVKVLGHCAECHTQRNLLGGRSATPLAGNTSGPNGAKVPGIRNLAQRPKPWSEDDIALSLQLGMAPSGDFFGGTMEEVVSHSTSKLTLEDIDAIADYLINLK